MFNTGDFWKQKSLYPSKINSRIFGHTSTRRGKVCLMLPPLWRQIRLSYLVLGKGAKYGSRFLFASSFWLLLIFFKFRILGVATPRGIPSFERKLKLSQKYCANMELLRYICLTIVFLFGVVFCIYNVLKTDFLLLPAPLFTKVEGQGVGL